MTSPTNPFQITTNLTHRFSQPTILNHWEHGISFINTVYDHKGPDFRMTWHHFLKEHNKSAFVNLQASILRTITTAYATPHHDNNSTPIWWLLLHLNMLIFAPSTTHQHNSESIQSSIHDHIEAAFLGDIKYLFESAMQVSS